METVQTTSSTVSMTLERRRMCRGRVYVAGVDVLRANEMYVLTTAC